MQVLSKFSPATYVLEGVRAGLIDGVPITALWWMSGRWSSWPSCSSRRDLGLRSRRAVRQADRQAEAGRADGQPTRSSNHASRTWAGPGRPPPSCRSTGRPVGRPASWVPHATPGRRAPTAIHAVIAGRLRHEALGPGDFPVVGDWVALGPRRRRPRVSGRSCPAGRFARGASAVGSAAAAQEQVLAANVDTVFIVAALTDLNLRRLERYLTLAWPAARRPWWCSTRPTCATTPRASRIAAEAVAPGVAVRTSPC